MTSSLRHQSKLTFGTFFERAAEDQSGILKYAPGGGLSSTGRGSTSRGPFWKGILPPEICSN